MHYVKHFNINGVATKQVACIELPSPPNAATEGAVGVLGIDMSSPTHEVYRCVNVKGSVYTWELLSAGMSIIGATITGEGEKNKTFPYSALLLPDKYLIKVGDLILDSDGYVYRISKIGNDSCDVTYTGIYLGSMVDVVELETLLETSIESLKKENELLKKRVTNLEGATLEYTEDDSTSYERVVPSNVQPYALVSKIGGKTTKTPINFIDRLNIESRHDVVDVYYDEDGIERYRDVTITVNEDGSIRFKGSNTDFTASYSIINWSGNADTYHWEMNYTNNNLSSVVPVLNAVSGYYDEEFETTIDANYMGSSIVEFSGTTEYIDYLQVDIAIDGSGVEFDFTIKPVLEREGYGTLEDTKVTALESEGANLIPFPYYSERFGVMDVGFELEWAGLTFKVNADRSISVKGTATSTPGFVICQGIEFSGEDFYLSGNMRGTKEGRAYCYTVSDGEYYTDELGFTKIPANKKFNWVGIQIIKGAVVDLTYKPMLNRGSEALPYKPYSAEPIDTFPISEELRAFLDEHGYGKGIPDTEYYNYIDLERKVFVQRAKTIRLKDVEDYASSRIESGTENDYISANGTVCTISYKLNDFAITDKTIRYESLCDKLPMTTDWTGRTVGIHLVQMSNGAHHIKVTILASDCGVNAEDAYNVIVKKIKQWLDDNNPILTYPLETPIETPIPAELLPIDTFIKVEGGGTITAVNENEEAEAVKCGITYLLKEGSI